MITKMLMLNFSSNNNNNTKKTNNMHNVY